jgi:type II secretory pathway component GspD/PulD (secretin)
MLLVLSALLLPRPSWAQQSESLVSIEAKSEDVRQVLQQLATTNGINIVVDDSLTTRVTMRLQNVPLDQALQSIAKAASATVVYDAGVYLFLNSRTAYTPPQPQSEPTTAQVRSRYSCPGATGAWMGEVLRHGEDRWLCADLGQITQWGYFDIGEL